MDMNEMLRVVEEIRLRLKARSGRRRINGNSYPKEKSLDIGAPHTKVKMRDNKFDGAPLGNQNAAGPHRSSGGGKGRTVGKAEREKISNRFVGKTTSNGTKITKISDHAFDRLGGRLMSPGRMQRMIDSTDVKPDAQHADRKVYDIPGSRMVIADNGTIVTMMWRKRNR